MKESDEQSKEVTEWVQDLMKSEDGVRRLAALREEEAAIDAVRMSSSAPFTAAASFTDPAALLHLKGGTWDVLTRPQEFGLPADSLFVGRYMPVINQNKFEVFYYQVGVSVVLVWVFGTAQPDEDRRAQVQALIGSKNEVNFVPGESARSDRAFVHNQLKNHAGLSRPEAALVGEWIIGRPIEFVSDLLENRQYVFVESKKPPDQWPWPQPGRAGLKLSSSPPRPAMGFILQMPTGTASTPVCVLSPTRNNHPTRDPSGTDPIYFTPDQLVLKMY